MRPDYSIAQAHFAALDKAGLLPEDVSTWHGDIDNCQVCSRPMNSETYMIDGHARAEEGSLWANLCVLCAYKTSPTIDWGVGQLYRRHEERWCLVAGGPPSDEYYDEASTGT